MWEKTPRNLFTFIQWEINVYVSIHLFTFICCRTTRTYFISSLKIVFWTHEKDDHKSCKQLFDFLSKDKFKGNYEKEGLISLICVVMSYTLRCTAPNHKPCELCICSSTIQHQFVISIDRDGHSINYIYIYEHNFFDQIFSISNLLIILF